MLYGPDGSRVRSVRSRPEPNGDTEQKVRMQLQSIDALLDIVWMPHAVYNHTHKDFEGRYALACRWPQGDPRWELYQKGEIEEPYDMLGYFCLDIQDANSVPVAPDMIEQKVMELLGKCDGNRLPHTKRMAQLANKNKKLRESRKQEAVSRAEDLMRDLHYISGHREESSLERIRQEIMEEAKHE